MLLYGDRRCERLIENCHVMFDFYLKIYHLLIFEFWMAESLSFCVSLSHMRVHTHSHSQPSSAVWSVVGFGQISFGILTKRLPHISGISSISIFSVLPFVVLKPLNVFKHYAKTPFSSPLSLSVILIFTKELTASRYGLCFWASFTALLWS